jgi:uncharacterized damage-inducible protein DinB
MTKLSEMIQQHIDYSYWAHRRVWDCVMQLSDTHFKQPLDYSVGAICSQIVHTMWAEEVWLSRIQGAALPTYTADDFADRTTIRAYWDALEARLRSTVINMDDAALLQPIHYQNSRGDQFEQTVLQILLHLVNHGTDHRAQTLAMLHILGAETVAQDLIYYYRADEL